MAAALRRAIDPRSAEGAPCQTSYTASDGSDKLTGVIDTVGEKVAGVLGEVTRRAPHAKVYLVGYPALLPADPASCASALGGAVTAGDLAFLAAQEQRLNTVLKDRAKAVSVTFVDTYTPSLGHDMCSGQSARWIEPPFPAAGGPRCTRTRRASKGWRRWCSGRSAAAEAQPGSPSRPAVQRAAARITEAVGRSRQRRSGENQRISAASGTPAQVSHIAGSIPSQVASAPPSRAPSGIRL